MALEPCKHCKSEGICPEEGLVNYLAIEFFVKDLPFECADFEADNYHGIEGVFA